MDLRLELASLKHERAFIEAARASRSLHQPWVSSPVTSPQYRRYLETKSTDRHIAYLVFSKAGELVASVNLNEIVRGGFCSAYLGYSVFSPYQRRGVMTAALSMVVTRAFRAHGLHRVEANIQPANAASIGLVRGLGFRKEGLSPRYLKINGRWRDHERWAVTREEWKSQARASRRVLRSAP